MEFDPVAKCPEPVMAHHLPSSFADEPITQIEPRDATNRYAWNPDDRCAASSHFAESFRVLVVRIFAFRLRLRRPPTCKQSCRAHQSALGKRRARTNTTISGKRNRLDEHRRYLGCKRPRRRQCYDRHDFIQRSFYGPAELAESCQRNDNCYQPSRPAKWCLRGCNSRR